MRRSPRTSRLVSAVVALALLSLVHTIDHDALFGAEHHADGDASAALVQFVELSLGLLLLAASIGFLLDARRRRSEQRRVAGSWLLAPSADVVPRARAGPTLSRLQVIRR